MKKQRKAEQSSKTSSGISCDPATGPVGWGAGPGGAASKQEPSTVPAPPVPAVLYRNDVPSLGELPGAEVAYFAGWA